MRKPNMKDIFLAAKIARKTELKRANIDMSGTAEEIGGKLIFHILENLDKAEEEIIQLVSGILEMKPEWIAEMPLDDLFSRFKEMEGLGDFFSGLGRSMTSNSMTSSSADTGASNLS